jgi:hypothetical protein
LLHTGLTGGGKLRTTAHCAAIAAAGRWSGYFARGSQHHHQWKRNSTDSYLRESAVGRLEEKEHQCGHEPVSQVQVSGRCVLQRIHWQRREAECQRQHTSSWTIVFRNKFNRITVAPLPMTKFACPKSSGRCVSNDRIYGEQDSCDKQGLKSGRAGSGLQKDSDRKRYRSYVTLFMPGLSARGVSKIPRCSSSLRL